MVEIWFTRIEIIMGVVLFALGFIGLIRVKSDLWGVIFALISISGFLMVSNSVLVYGIKFFNYAVELIYEALIIVAVALLVYFLNIIYVEPIVSVVMLPRSTLGKMANRLSSMYGNAAARVIVYTIGKDCGFTHVASSLKKYNMSNEKFISRLPLFHEFFAWGTKLKIIQYKPNENIIIRAYNNFETTQKEKTDVPSCDFTRGYFAGIGKALHPNMICETDETKCKSKGDYYCEFRVIFTPWEGLLKELHAPPKIRK